MLRTAHLVATFTLLVSASAQNPSRPPQGQSQPNPTAPSRSTGPNLIGICLPGGKIAVDLKTVSSIGLHSYTVDNASRVWELTIDNGGSSLIRIYSVSTLSPNEPALDMAKVELEALAETASKALGIDTWAKVQKNYPTSTHAKTVEYRVKTVKELLQLRKLLFKAWANGTAGRIDLAESTNDILPLDLEKF